MATADTPTATIAVNQLPWQPTEQEEFSRLVREHQYWKLQEDAAKHEKADISKRIEAMLLLAEPEAKVSIQSERWIVQRVTNRGADRLDGKLLLQQGVSATIIQNATVPGKPYSYVLVTNIAKG